MSLANTLADGDVALGAIAGNGGHWFELVVIDNDLDVRGWRLVMSDNGGSSQQVTDEFIFADDPLLDELEEDLRKEKNRLRTIRTLVLKLKFEDFSRTTIERAADHVDRELFQTLLHEAWPRGGGKSIRLIGAGVRFQPEQSPSDDRQLSLFDFE